MVSHDWNWHTKTHSVFIHKLHNEHKNTVKINELVFASDGYVCVVSKTKILTNSKLRKKWEKGSFSIPI